MLLECVVIKITIKEIEIIKLLVKTILVKIIIIVIMIINNSSLQDITKMMESWK